MSCAWHRVAKTPGPRHLHFQLVPVRTNDVPVRRLFIIDLDKGSSSNRRPDRTPALPLESQVEEERGHGFEVVDDDPHVVEPLYAHADDAIGAGRALRVP
ncbi:MAG: hypothetical protein ACR2JK_06665 [Geodermatophilaceae bacterium]